MSHKQWKLTWVFAFWMTTMAGNGFAADFIIHVPVDFKNLHPEVDAVQVRCRVFPSIISESQTFAGTLSNHIGSQSVEVSRPSNGTLNNPVTLEINAAEGKNPADAVKYRCQFKLKKGGIYSDPSPNTQELWKKTQQGSTLTKEFTANIP